MTETTYTRSRRASLGGLLLQLVAFSGALALSLATNSAATNYLAWYLLGGVPIWFVVLLVFRQSELAALEALDLEELRRERQTGGGGEALFDQGGAGGLGFRVAQARLVWMQRWLVPGFGVATAIYLALMGILLWRRLAVRRLIGGVELPGLAIGGEGWPNLTNVPIAMVILAILMLGIFLLSRYTSGMGRVREWQLLRGCGSYMLGNALVTMALLVCLGVQQYTAVASWEQALAYAIPVLMIVLAIETLINFVLDIYRPRAPGVEPRACFDSRLLGLLAEPGGIASSIADAINYQFGFQVSQTWFYKLLERTFAWLILAGAAALWLLTCVVVVQPYEHVIIERWGRQLNARHPLGPGLHFKRPWPWEMARSYNTEQLHEIHVGYQKADAQPSYDQALKNVLLWTDDKHLGQEHFDLLICPPLRKGEEGPVLPTSLPGPDQGVASKESPVNLIRMDAAVQYRIRADRLDLFTAGMVDPHGAMRDIAWEEVVRFCAATTAEDLLARELAQLGTILGQRIAPRVENLGLEVVYVGVTNVHPEKTVAEAYRNVVKAEQEKVAAIREALVTENERLSKVAGDARSARLLANAVERNRKASELVNDADKVLSRVDPAVVDEFSARLAEMEPLFRAHVDAAARLEWTQDQKRQVDLEFELGLGQTVDQQEQAGQAVVEAEKSEQAAAAALEAAAAELRQQAVARLGPVTAEALILGFEAHVARTYWEERLEAQFTPARLEGEAAAVLAKALAERWVKEMKAAKDLAQMRNERQAYRAAPEVYKTRRLIEVLVDGIKDARKFFLAFDPGDRLVRVRFITEDDLRLEPTDIRPERQR